VQNKDSQCAYKRNNKARSQNYFTVEKQELSIFSAYICSLSYPKCKTHAFYTVVCGMSWRATFFS